MKEKSKEVLAYLKDIFAQYEKAENKLIASNQQLQASEQQLKAANQQLDASNQQLTANEQQLKAANQQLTANNQQLIATEQQLKTANQQLSASEQKLKATNQQLSERVKEMSCFYGICKIVEIPGISLEEIIQKTVELIPASLQYPEITVCRIILDGKEYKTPEFKKTKWKLCSNIMLDGNHAGDIEVYYLEKKPDIDQGPFLKEERMLLDTIAKRLGKIIERKQVEKTLKENEKRYREIFQFSPDSIIIHDLDMNILDVNNKALEEFGYSKTELLKKMIFKLHPKTELKHSAQVLDAVNKKEMLNIETRFVRKDGSVFLAEATPCKYTLGNKLVIHVTIRDITERKRNEQIQEVIHNISNAVAKSDNPEEFIMLVKNELETIIDTNNFYVALYDESTDSISLLYHEDKKDKIKTFPAGKTLTKYVIKTKKSLLATKDVKDKLVRTGEVELLGADSKVWLGVPLFAKGKVSGVIAVQSYEDEKAYNDTDMRTLEIISDQVSVSLERKKAEQDLRLAIEKAEESNRLKSAFLSNMSHEIRTPLNGITGLLGLLQESEIEDEEKQQYFDIINKSSDRLIATITDIIDISRIEAGQVKVVKTEVSINKILDEQNNFFYREAKSKGLELIYRPTLSDKEARIVTDKHKLEGILTNLIKNAIKFTEQGKITFGYSLKKEKDFEFLEFYVKDTGVGIPSNRIKAVFNRFEQADIEDTRVYEGSGLGLAISKSYVEMLDGNISVTSEEGKGSTFTFSIPYTKQFVKESDDKGNVYIESLTSLSNLSVIIAEDEEASIMLFEAIFKNIFNKITYTKTGKETIDKCRENPEADLILMDIKMPDMNGYDATRQIRKFNRDIVIIAQTAYGLSGDKEKAIEAGCNDYISKPIKKAELLALIQKCFNK